MRERKRHILKAEFSENGAIYKEKSVDIYSIILFGLIAVLIAVVLVFLTVQFILPLFASGVYSHV